MVFVSVRLTKLMSETTWKASNKFIVGYFVILPLALNPSVFNLSCRFKIYMLELKVVMYASKLVRFYLSWDYVAVVYNIDYQYQFFPLYLVIYWCSVGSHIIDHGFYLIDNYYCWPFNIVFTFSHSHFLPPTYLFPTITVIVSIYVMDMRIIHLVRRK